jgi:molecular chaperone GrpE
MNSSPDDHDVDFEPEDELGSVNAYKEKLEKCRDELRDTRKEKGEYLDGWQRAKADLINERKELMESGRRLAEAAIARLLEDLIPALDSFDMAMRGDAWQNVDPTWRIGMESVARQIVFALNAHGITEFGAQGDVYNPQFHEVVQEVPGNMPGSVASVLRRGWKLKERVIRPAHVALVREQS